MSRRFFLRSAAGIGLGLSGTAGYAVGIEPTWEGVVKRPLPLRGLPDAWMGKRIAQVSDLHAGPRVSGSFLRRVFSELPELQPDLVVVTGDWVTMHDRLPDQPLADALTALTAATIDRGVPVLACLGNHDFGSAWTNTRLADQLATHLTDRGIDLLRNHSMTIDGLTFAGVDDLWSPAFVPEEVVDSLPSDRDAIVLCHNPDGMDTQAFVEGRWSGVMLSGHTHGGQCRLPLLGRPLLPIRNARYAAGWVDVSNTRKLYVNVGLGHSHRVRFGVRPEVTVFTLKRST
ncbi:MAG: metallophosphoesterase [Planctomycetota bacterium]